MVYLYVQPNPTFGYFVLNVTVPGRGSVQTARIMHNAVAMSVGTSAPRVTRLAHEARSRHAAQWLKLVSLPVLVMASQSRHDTLTIRGATRISCPPDKPSCSDGSMQRALELIPGVGSVTVTVEDIQNVEESIAERLWYVTFAGYIGDMPQMNVVLSQSKICSREEMKLGPAVQDPSALLIATTYGSRTVRVTKETGVTPTTGLIGLMVEIWYAKCGLRCRDPPHLQPLRRPSGATTSEIYTVATVDDTDATYVTITLTEPFVGPTSEPNTRGRLQYCLGSCRASLSLPQPRLALSPRLNLAAQKAWGASPLTAR